MLRGCPEIPGFRPISRARSGLAVRSTGRLPIQPGDGRAARSGWQEERKVLPIQWPNHLLLPQRRLQRQKRKWGAIQQGKATALRSALGHESGPSPKMKKRLDAGSLCYRPSGARAERL